VGVFHPTPPSETRVKKPGQRLQVRRNIDLLATIEESGAAAKKSPKGFGNIIELGTRALIIETNRQLAVGASLTVNVVFPGQQRGDDPFAHLHCKVRKAHDDPKLHYDLMIVNADDRTRDRLNIYLAQSGTGRGT
jgi:hypothetical protein